jgi:hypothetical protein
MILLKRKICISNITKKVLLGSTAMKEKMQYRIGWTVGKECPTSLVDPDLKKKVVEISGKGSFATLRDLCVRS